MARRMKIRILTTLALSALGFAVSLYLLSVHWGWWQVACFGAGECEIVNTSRYSELLGIPVALLGAFTYLCVGLSSILIWRGVLADHAARVQFFLAMTGIAFSIYLTAMELFVLHAICPWCVSSAIVIALIGAVSLCTLRDISAREQAAAPVAAAGG
jgi:uncharacterized membrane protein